MPVPRGSDPKKRARHGTPVSRLQVAIWLVIAIPFYLCVTMFLVAFTVEMLPMDDAHLGLMLLVLTTPIAFMAAVFTLHLKTFIRGEMP